MYSAKTRPIPSKAALKVLYQLAYISSGTAVGVAALCAEERRRRTRVVQRIADNAKRIRQSSRHYQNAALATAGTDDLVGGGGYAWVGHHEAQSGARESSKRSRRGQIGTEEHAARDPKLPSAVENGYAQVSSDGMRKTAKLRRAQGRTQSKSPRGTHAVDAPTFDGAGEYPSRARVVSAHDRYMDSERTFWPVGKNPQQASYLRPAPSSDTTQQRHKTKPSRIPRPDADGSGDGKVRHGGKNGGRPHPPVSRERSLSIKDAMLPRVPPVTDQSHLGSVSAPPTLVHDPHAAPDDGGDTIKSSDADPKHLGGTSGDETAQSSEEVGQSIPAPVHVPHTYGSINIRFVGHAKRKVSATEISITRRGSTPPSQPANTPAINEPQDRVQETVTSNDPNHLPLTAPAQPSGGTTSGLQVFTQETAISDDLDPVPVTATAQTSSETTSDQETSIPQAADQAEQQALRNAEEDTSQLAVTKAEEQVKAVAQMRELRGEVRSLVSDSRFDTAVKSLLARKDSLGSRRAYRDLVYEVFDAAIAPKSMRSVVHLLRILDATTTSFDGRYAVRCDRLLHLCDSQAAYSKVVHLFDPKVESHLAEPSELSEKSNEIIAFACTQVVRQDTQLRELFEVSFRQVPMNMRSRIAESWSTLPLMTLWQSTHNLERVKQEAERLRALASLGDQSEAIRRLDRALLDIYISANAHELALEYLARSHNAAPNDLYIVLTAALLFAKKGGWDSLARLLVAAKASRTRDFDTNTARRFNNILQLYCKAHDTTESWKFITSVVDDLGFLPNYATSEIMLKSFISRKDLHYIPKWIRYVSILGRNFKLDASMSAKLLTRYYLDFRPSHILVMWFCRNLANYAPSLAGPDYLDLVKESIGFDIKTMVGQNVHWRRANAGARLDMLREMKVTVPSPGWVWNEQLVLEHPDRATPQLPLPSDVVDVRVESNSGQLDQEASMQLFTPLSDGHHELSAHSAQDNMDPVKSDAESNAARVVQIGPGDVDHAQSFPDVGVEGEIELDDHAGSPQTRTVTASEPMDFDAMYWEMPDSDEHEEPTTAEHLDELDEPDSLEDANEDPLDDNITNPLPQKTTKPERDMLLALSLGQNKKVLTLYHASLDATYLPPSPTALTTAIKAGLRLDRGPTSQAHTILRDAQRGGFNTTCALGPLLINQIYSLRRDNPSPSKTEIESLKRAVIEYYHLNDTNTWPISHHVGVTAANVLIDANYPEQGISLLRTIYQSEWAAKRPLDIAAMTIFLKGYAATGSTAGLAWVFKNVLKRDDMLINRPFLITAKRCIKRFGKQEDTAFQYAGPKQRERAFMAPLVDWVQRCYERRTQQMLETKVLGRKLVDVLAAVAKEQEKPVVQTTRRLEIEDELFGPRRKVGELLTGKTMLKFTPLVSVESEFGGKEEEEEVRVWEKEKTARYDDTPLVGIETSRHDSPFEEAAAGEDYQYRPFNSIDIPAPQPPSAQLQSANPDPLKSALATSIQLRNPNRTRPIRATSFEKYKLRWLRQYRAFLRHRLVMPGGAHAAFQFELADDAGNTLAAKRRRKEEKQNVGMAEEGGKVDVNEVGEFSEDEVDEVDVDVFEASAEELEA